MTSVFKKLGKGDITRFAGKDYDRWGYVYNFNLSQAPAFSLIDKSFICNSPYLKVASDLVLLDDGTVYTLREFIELWSLTIPAYEPDSSYLVWTKVPLG